MDSNKKIPRGAEKARLKKERHRRTDKYFFQEDKRAHVNWRLKVTYSD